MIDNAARMKIDDVLAFFYYVHNYESELFLKTIIANNPTKQTTNLSVFIK